MSRKTVLAVDLGAESGRVMAVHLENEALYIEELHRFGNPVTEINGTLTWDFLHLWREITAGIAKGRPLNPLSVGVDTWGVDFGLLDKNGDLIGNPINYRDRRTAGMIDVVIDKVGREAVFAQTGIQFIPINSLYQLMSLVESKSPQLEMAATFLTAPDLINYWLTGRKVCEFTNATTTQLLNPQTGSWATDLMAQLGIPTHIFPEIVTPGTLLGHFEGLPVIAPASHDTGSAVAGVPAANLHYAYISSGTWSLVGIEVDRPILSAAALAANVTNEGGVYGRYRLLKNVMGLWIVQQCRDSWAAEGDDLSYQVLVDLAEEAGPAAGWFDANDPSLLPPGDHPARVQALCRAAEQPVPQSKGQIIRCVLESLAREYARVLDQIEEVAGRPIEVVHIVGGGCQNRLLNQLTAAATGRPVIAGPVEATVLGNALVQFIALGEIEDLKRGRKIIGGSCDLVTFRPEE